MQRCLGAGRWEHAALPRARLPDIEQCPPILSRYSWIGTMAERQIECCTGHRQAAITRNVFRPCEADEAGGASPAPTITDVLAAIRGRTIVLVGDSTMHQLWTALVAELFASGQPIDVTQERRDSQESLVTGWKAPGRRDAKHRTRDGEGRGQRGAQARVVGEGRR